MTDPFDRLAPTYDETFTDTLVGGLLRRAVWRRLDELFAPGQDILEINGGTGVDAEYLARRGVRVHLTDASAGMIDQARTRMRRADVGHLVTTEVMPIEDTAARLGVARFDGVLSNFGGLNCLADLGGVAAQLAAVTRPAACLLAVVMGPTVPWEWVWYGARRDWKTAGRRRQKDGVEWRGRRIWYPGVPAVHREFGTWFRITRTWGLGVLIPPTYANAWAERHPRLVKGLDWIERRMERIPPVPRFGDHYVVEMVRRGG